jgi:hypothetical protein
MLGAVWHAEHVHFLAGSRHGGQMGTFAGDLAIKTPSLAAQCAHHFFFLIHISLCYYRCGHLK